MENVIVQYLAHKQHTCMLYKCAMFVSQISCHEQAYPLNAICTEAKKWHGSGLKNVMGYNRVIM